MIEKLYPYADLLRVIGNFRLSYAIFLDQDLMVSDQEAYKRACLSVPIKRCIINFSAISVKHDSKDANYEYATVTSYEEVLTYCKDTNVVTIVIDTLANLHKHGEYMLLFNEIHTFNSPDKAWQPSMYSKYIYLQPLINDGELIAYRAPRDNGIMLPDAKFEDWHLVMLHRPTNVLLKVMWDSREILGIWHLTQEQRSIIERLKPANDNSRLLYCYDNMRNQLPPELEKYVSNYVLSYL